MKAYFYIFMLFTFVYQGLGQTEFPDDGYVSYSGDYALINDYQNLEIDKENSKVTFDFIDEETSGTIEGLDFKINFNPNDPNNSSFAGTALVETLDTDNFLRDGHLMWKKFFHESKYPKISFESKQVVDFDNNTFKVIGNLTIKGTTKEVILTFSLHDKKLVGKTTIHTSDYGVNIHDERKRNKLNIQFHFPIIK
ncbi:YceI family protein [Aquimarina sp. MMG016]|uniref:YceI family protein n=1 Tax=Aquimarina sp. MMG016 TaxID=2822690 RepID=UPI001B3A394A|nr:YceI family protein [Aquimarina sp. MMG016]MBQ4819469.1 YceI family protein [Aquimarina sp. MMG016]